MRGGGLNRETRGLGRAHFFASAGRNGVASHCVLTLTTSTIGERIESLFLLSFLQCATTTTGATTRTKKEGGTMLGSSQVCGYDNDKHDDDNNDYRVATICDGGILVLRFPSCAHSPIESKRKECVW